MKAIIRRRDSGKARELITFAAENNATIVTENPFTFKVKAEAYGYPNVNIIAWEDLTHMIEIPDKIIIHNMDKFVNFLFENKVIGFSATMED